jgi:hypothetical protein
MVTTFYRRGDNQNNNIWHKGTQHNVFIYYTQHNDTQHYDTQHNDTQHNDTAKQFAEFRIFMLWQMSLC